MICRRFVWLCAGALAGLLAPGLAEAQLNTAFAAYCKATDRSPWHCEARTAALSAEQTWDIVAAYCLDYVGQTGSRRAADIQKGIDGNPSPPNAKEAVCVPFKAAVEPLALRFDHRRGEWEDNGELFKSQGRDFSLDRLTRIPTVHLNPGDRIGIVVTETNPVLYAANRGEAREDNIDAIKGLEKLLGVLGGALGPLLADGSAAAAKDANRAATREEDDRDRIKRWAEVLNTPLTNLKDRLKAYTDERARIQLAAQMLESGPAPLKGSLDEALEKPATWRLLFESVSAALDTVPDLQACATLFEAFPDITTAATPVLTDAATVRVLQLLDAPEPPCGKDLRYPGVVDNTAREIQRAARAALSGGQPQQTALLQRQALAREQNLQHVLVLRRMMTQLSGTQASARDVLLKEEETRKGAVSLKIVADRVRDAGFRRDGDQVLLVNRIYLPDEVFDTSWTKIRVTPMKVAVNSPYADQVPTTQPKEVSTSYRLVRKNFDRFSVAAGIVYTEVANVVYTAVDPDPTSNETTSISRKTSIDGTDTTVTTAIPELKRIAEKERQSRAGSFGMFANYRLIKLGALGVGLQGGVAISADNPAFFGGFSINAGSYLVVGVGCGAFRVKSLGIGPSGVRQQVNDLVVGSDDIRMESTWTHECLSGRKDAYYLSLSLNLSGLPLFSPK